MQESNLDMDSLHVDFLFTNIAWDGNIGICINKRHTRIPGLWTQELDAGLWTMDSGLWALDAELWTLDAGLWTLVSGHWMLNATLRKLGSGH